MLVVMTGPPGTGKSTIAEAIAKELSTPVFSVDSIEATLNRAGITREHRSDYAAYDLLATLAAEQLERGQSAVLDAVNALGFLREWWQSIADRFAAPTVFIATTCSDQALLRERVTTRRRPIEGFMYDLDWDGVQARMAEYEPFIGECLTLDAGDSLDGNIATATDYVLSRRS